ncbi:serine palmitoyltransferase component [Castilleja foliolosa]|uniref:Serine palmitoyltransferase component n=1 Tax=Castilleja foliolosa TaxID=1961234 RepID=A0ABD3EK67_9LAMI
MMVVGAGGASRWSRLRDPVAVSWFYIFVRPEGNNRLDLNNLPEEYSTTRDGKQLSDDTSSSAVVSEGRWAEGSTDGLLFAFGQLRDFFRKIFDWWSRSNLQVKEDEVGFAEVVYRTERN